MLPPNPTRNSALIDAESFGGDFLRTKVGNEVLVDIGHDASPYGNSHILEYGNTDLQEYGRSLDNFQMEYKDRLKAARKHAGLTQGELAKRAGLTQTSVSDLERGKSKATAFTAQIAKVCGVDPIWLAQGRGHMLSPNSLHSDITELYKDTAVSEGNGSFDVNVELAPQPTRSFDYPEISWVQAGMAREAVQVLNLSECEKHTSDAWAGPHGYWLKVKGPSMTSPAGVSFMEGMLILVAPGIEPENGSFVVAKMIATNEATFKQYIWDSGKAFLKPLNSAFPTVEMDDTWELVGKVVDAKWPRTLLG